jgi:hypothetical protein
LAIFGIFYLLTIFGIFSFSLQHNIREYCVVCVVH